MITIDDESYFRLRMKLRMNRQDALERVTPFLFVGNNRYELRAGPSGPDGDSTPADFGCARRRTTIGQASSAWH